MKIGILADTHLNRNRLLPPRVIELLRGVEIVLHAGDIASLAVLQQLENEASLTFAVYGESDPPELRKYLQEKQILEFAGKRIGLIHGHRAGRTEWTARVRGLFLPQAPSPTLADYVIAQFADTPVDAIVFGHSHAPYLKMHRDVFLFNPGTVHRSSTPTLGFLEIDERGIQARIMPV